jgi:predicted DNA-binding transcriptional regulator YafY
MSNSTISSAIRDKRLLQFTYEGSLRLVEPHVYGEYQDGYRVLRAWQRSPALTGWKLFREDKMSGIRTSDMRFDGPRADYKRGDKTIRPVYAAL